VAPQQADFNPKRADVSAPATMARPERSAQPETKCAASTGGTLRIIYFRRAVCQHEKSLHHKSLRLMSST
jgi:hypothetical protein